MHLTENFTLKEFIRSDTATRLHIDNTPSQEIIDRLTLVAQCLETIRAQYGVPITVNSGYRCSALNAAIGGSKTSMHMQGLAVDFEIPKVSNLALANKTYQIIEMADQVIYEFGEDGWVHLGLSKDPPRRQLMSAVRHLGNTGSSKTIYIVHHNGLIIS